MMCADTSVVQEEDEEDPSNGKSALDEYALLSDLGKSYTSSFSPPTDTIGGAYNQFNITYIKGK